MESSTWRKTASRLREGFEELWKAERTLSAHIFNIPDTGEPLLGFPKEPFLTPVLEHAWDTCGGMRRYYVFTGSTEHGLDRYKEVAQRASTLFLRNERIELIIPSEACFTSLRV